MSHVFNFHVHMEMKNRTISTCTDHEITLKEVSWYAQALFDTIIPEGIWDVGGTSIAHVLRFSSHGIIQGLAQTMTCWKLFGFVNLSLKAGELLLSQKLFLLVEPKFKVHSLIGILSRLHFTGRLQLWCLNNSSTRWGLKDQVKARASPANGKHRRTHIAETEVERLLRKMLLKLISTTLPITLNPSMQFLVFILLSWRAGMHQEAFKRHVSIACLAWPLSNLGHNLDVKVLFALQDYRPFHCAHDLGMATCKQRTLCQSPLAKSLTECHTHSIPGVLFGVTLN